MAKFVTTPRIIITREIRLDLSAGDFEDDLGFYIRSATNGTIRYLPYDATTDAEYIEKDIEASPYFIDPVICRKIFSIISSPATDVYIGYGV
jgi:hypothetical protein